MTGHPSLPQNVASFRAESPPRSLYHGVKRAVDVAGALVALALLAPVLALVAVAIKVESRGPVLYRQRRVGSRRVHRPDRDVWVPVVFDVFKFRSMRVDADERVHAARVQQFVAGAPGVADDGARWKPRDDGRLTRVGRVIRRLSLDELPQLGNVLRGDMSLVGPRPVPVYEAVLYDDAHLQRLAARPGITGLWQVNGRCGLGFEEMVQLDRTYVQRRSFGLDAKILLLTVPAVLLGRGAG